MLNMALPIISNSNYYLANVALETLMQTMISTWYGIGIKVILTSLVALWLYVRKAKKTLIFVNVFMGLVVVNNLFAITLMVI